MTENPSTQVFRALCYILDQVKGFNKRFVFYWNETKYVVDIKKFKMKRSLDQNAVIQMWFTYLENQTGQPKNDLYRYYESKFSTWERKEMKYFGEYYLPRPVKTFNTAEFSKYLEEVREEVRELTGYSLPLPNETEWENFYLSYKDK